MCFPSLELGLALWPILTDPFWLKQYCSNSRLKPKKGPAVQHWPSGESQFPYKKSNYPETTMLKRGPSWPHGENQRIQITVRIKDPKQDPRWAVLALSCLSPSSRFQWSWNELSLLSPAKLKNYKQIIKRLLFLASFGGSLLNKR